VERRSGDGPGPGPGRNGLQGEPVEREVPGDLRQDKGVHANVWHLFQVDDRCGRQRVWIGAATPDAPLQVKRKKKHLIVITIDYEC